MPLADDLMEPFRPAIDAMVRIGMVGAGCEEGVTPEAKRRLVKTLFLDIDTNRGITPLMTCIHRLASSLAELFLEEREELEIAPAPAGDLLKQRLLAESGNEDTDGIPADVDDGDV
jgi:CRISPR-associated protein Cas1